MIDALRAIVPLRWLVFAHVVSAFAFFLAHGPSVAAMLMLRNARDVSTVRALLDMSRAASVAMMASFVALALTGALLATLERSWSQPWLWGSILILLVISAVMGPLGARVFNEARIAAGTSWNDGLRRRPATAQDDAALAIALARIRARTMPSLWVGIAGAIILIWLMTIKPGA